MARDVSKVDVYLDDKGNFVAGDNPNVAIQVAHKGVEIPRKVAARHGLNADGSAKDAPAKAAEPKKSDTPKPVLKTSDIVKKVL